MYREAYRFDDNTVFYFDHYDNKYVAKGKTLSWRLNNPGLLHAHDSIVRKIGIIGAQFPYAIFSSVRQGGKALRLWLKSIKRSDETLATIAKYYRIDNDLESLDKLIALTGLKADQKLKELSFGEFNQFIVAIETYTGFLAENRGEFVLLPKITARYFSKKKDVERYLVGFETLLTKEEAIKWIETHQLDAVLVHKSDGKVYIRSRRGSHLNQIRYRDHEYGKEEEFKDVVRDFGEKKKNQPIWGYINGVWNDHEKAEKSISLISSYAEGDQVWSLINNTKTKIGDLIACGVQKLKLDTTVVKFAVKFLEFLLTLAKESGKSTPVIIFAHSQGAIIADLALDVIKEEDRKQLRIFTFGGGSFISPGKSHPDSHNYISQGDAIPRIASYSLSKLVLRREEERQRGVSDKHIIELLAEEDLEDLLDEEDSIAENAFRKARISFYEQEFAKIANVTLVQISKVPFLPYLDHSFRAECYQQKVKEIVTRYKYSKPFGAL